MAGCSSCGCHLSGLILHVIYHMYSAYVYLYRIECIVLHVYMELELFVLNSKMLPCFLWLYLQSFECQFEFFKGLGPRAVLPALSGR